ncbi:hypothetical protein GGR21_000067 [Dysgonomonas hofstadii]|uniref:Uncharacterized protein n=1 Tax=Dysgonomonas hofstadii TaxID=637886 RepID=A0A840CNN8_9BACT|nr:hypothetical protein [Dysgonomonas hofstadii]MBB4034182.1 hypothetical protein [Dysgonomonas hofstadii]
MWQYADVVMKEMKNLDNKICKVCQVLLSVMLERSEASKGEILRSSG